MPTYRNCDRNIKHIGFVELALLNTAAKRKQLVSLIDGLPQNLIKADSPFVVSESHKATILFDDAAAEDWLAALEGQDHITDIYILTPQKKRFDELKAQVQDVLGPMLVTEEEKRPLAAGFPANLAYYKLEFLDKDRVALKRAFNEVLPLLWLKAGALGPPPEPVPPGQPLPAWLAPAQNSFAVLLDEDRPNDLLAALAGRSGLRLLFIVTDAEDAFKELSALFRDALGTANPALETVQLYRDYLDNFRLNAAAEGAA
jgi:adenine-specific DNA-methyltransferase